MEESSAVGLCFGRDIAVIRVSDLVCDRGTRTFDGRESCFWVFLESAVDVFVFCFSVRCSNSTSSCFLTGVLVSTADFRFFLPATLLSAVYVAVLWGVVAAEQGLPVGLHLVSSNCSMLIVGLVTWAQRQKNVHVMFGVAGLWHMMIKIRDHQILHGWTDRCWNLWNQTLCFLV